MIRPHGRTPRGFISCTWPNCAPNRVVLNLSLTGVGPIGPSLHFMQIPLKVLKVKYRQKLGIPQAGS